ncbi:MAG: Ig-like domain repeat protein [Myxococcota bacterium]
MSRVSRVILVMCSTWLAACPSPTTSSSRASISGQVVLEDVDGLNDTSRVQVDLGRGEGASTPDADGFFQFSDLEPDVYTITFTYVGGLTNEASGSAYRRTQLRVVARAGAETSTGPVRLELGRGTVRGEVAFPDGAVPQGAQVSLVDKLGVRRVATVDGTGFRLDEVPVGHHVLAMTVPGHATPVTQGHCDQPITLNIDGEEVVAAPSSFVPATPGIEPGAGEVAIAEGLTWHLSGDTLTVRVTAPFAREGRVWVGDATPDYEPFHDSGWVLQGLPAGVTTAHVQLRDPCGFETARYTLTLVRDLTAPLILAVELGDGAPYLTTATTSLSVQAADDRSGPLQMRHTLCTVDSDGMTPQCPVALEQVPWTDYAPRSSITLPGTEGTHAVQVQVRDQAGNTSTTETATVRLDLAGPTLSTVSLTGTAGAQLTRDTVVQLDVVAEGATTMLLSNRADFGGALTVPYASPVSWSLPSEDGAHTVFVRVQDDAGHGVDGQAAITLDRTPPTGLQVTLDSNAPYSATGVVDLELAAVDVLAGMARVVIASSPLFTDAETVTWSTGSGTVSVPQHVLPAGEGLQVVYARFVDRAGNVADAQATIVVDTLPPTGTVAINNGAEWTTSTAVTLRLTASPDVVEMAVADGDTLDCGGEAYDNVQPQLPWDLPTGAGPRAVSVCVRDAAGHIARLVDDILLDESDPTVTLSIDDGAPFARSAQVTLTVSTTEATEMMLSNRDDFLGSTWQPLVDAVGWALPATDAEHTVYVRVRDAAGNTAGDSASITLDRTPPGAVTVRVDEGGLYSTTGIVQVSVEAVDGLSGLARVAVANDPGFFDAVEVAWPTGAPSVEVSDFPLIPGEGQRSIHVRVDDVAGNSALRTVGVVVDLTPPDVQVSINQGAAVTQDTQVTLKVETSSDAAGMVILDGENAACPATVEGAVVTSLPWPLGGAGRQAVTVCVRDQAGHVASASDDITVDLDAPQLLSVVLADGAPDTADTRVTVAIDAQDVAPGTVAEMVLSESDAFVGASWEPFVANRVFTLSSTNGVKQVFAQVRDGAGRVSEVRSGSITLDTQPPVGISLEVPGGAFAGGAQVQVSLTAYDNLSVGTALTAALGDETLVCADATYDQDFGGCPAAPCTLVRDVPLSDGDGAKIITACLRDAAGNLSVLPLRVDITRDSQAPAQVTGVVVTAQSRRALLSWSNTLDAGPAGISHYDVELAGDATFTTVDSMRTATGTSLLVTGLPNLVTTWARVRAVDRAGNPGAFSAAVATVPGVRTTRIPEPLADRTFSSPVTVALGGDLYLAGLHQAGTAELTVMRCGISESDCRVGSSWRTTRITTSLPLASRRLDALRLAERFILAGSADGGSGYSLPVVWECDAEGNGCDDAARWSSRAVLSTAPAFGGFSPHAALTHNTSRVYVAFHQPSTGSSMAARVASCPRNTLCSWDEVTAMGNVVVDATNTVPSDANLAMAADDVGVFVGFVSTTRGLNVRRCNAATDCDLLAEWSAAYELPDTSGLTANIQLVHTGAHLYALFHVASDRTQRISRCALSSLCDAAADWSAPTVLFSDVDGLSAGTFVELREADGALHATWWRANDGSVAYGTCATSGDCTVATNWRVVTLSSTARAATVPSSVVRGGNLVTAWMDAQERLTLGLPVLFTPVGFGAGPGVESIEGAWLPTVGAQGYELLRDPDGTGGWLNAVPLPDSLQDQASFPTPAGATHTLSVRAWDNALGVSSDAAPGSTRPLTTGDPDDAAGVAPGIVTTDCWGATGPASSCGLFSSMSTGSTQWVSGLPQAGQAPWMYQCNRDVVDCTDPSAWTGVQLTSVPSAAGPAKLVASPTRLFAAFQTTVPQVWLTWCDLATGCDAVDEWSGFLVVDNSFVSSSDRVGKDLDVVWGGVPGAERIWVHTRNVSNVPKIHHCATNTDCTLAGNWVRNGAILLGALEPASLSVTSTDLTVMAPNSTSVQFRRCDITVNDCNAPAEWSAYTVRMVTGIKPVPFSTRLISSSNEQAFVTAWQDKVRFGICPFSAATCVATGDNRWGTLALEGVDTSTGLLLDLRKTATGFSILFSDGDDLRLAQCSGRCLERDNWRITSVLARPGLREPWQNRPVLHADADGSVAFSFLTADGDLTSAWQP